ncbi:restriction endonuclease subunit S [Meridianimaribacter flavus]|uniref:Type I restriction enzyme S subunit n=1 Tax=Meridianimaribacter flavus TaxID=571115 RepID=A0ABY2G8L9_9FLAO|nr:restriction endonuclease subunit S [Meridianimaribacter flavus]TDY14150.1 type I restriction enzyme S subunit [Meridianimaribacter flavus]
MTEYLLSDLLKIKNGRDHKHLEDGEIPVFGSGGIMRYANESLYEEESILLPRKGTLDNIQYTNKPFWTVDTIYYTEVNKVKVDAYYLYHYLKLLDLSNLNSGTGVPSMTFGAYYGIKISLPELKVQKQIAKVLSDLDAKIEVNNKINQELEALAKTIYDYWFVQFDFPDQNGKPYKSSGGKMVYNEELKREIPEGWNEGKFGEYATVSSGYAFKSSNWQTKGCPVLKIKDITEEGKVNTSDLAYVSTEIAKKANRFNSKEGDVIIAMTGATIGKFAIIPDDDYLINQRVGLYSLGKERLRRLPFLYSSLKQEYFRLQVFKIGSGAAQPNISGEQLDNIPLIFPKEDLIKKYNQKFEPFFKKILENQKENQKLAALRDWLLPMLMNGQVTVGEAKEELGMVAEDNAKYGEV